MSLKTSRFVRNYIRYMYFVGVSMNTHLFIQAYRIFSRKSAEDISGTAFTILLWALASWLVYGVVVKDRIIIFSNIIGVLGVIIVLAGKVIYGQI